METEAFKGKAALVTGAAVGIGRETAIGFAGAGATVVIADVLAREGESTAQAIRSRGGRATFVRTDVAREEDLAACVAHAIEVFGRLDYAVNNAGVELSGSPVARTTRADYERIMAINVGGVLFGMKHQIPAMLRGGGGAIVNVASIAGLIGFPGAGAYVASKHAVIGLTRTAALEHARDGIRVNAVCPGAIQTDMIDRFVAGDAQAKASLIGEHPMGRIGSAAEVASAILWLCSEGAAFVTGQYIPVDGGYTAR